MLDEYEGLAAIDFLDWIVSKDEKEDWSQMLDFFFKNLILETIENMVSNRYKLSINIYT